VLGGVAFSPWGDALVTAGMEGLDLRDPSTGASFANVSLLANRRMRTHSSNSRISILSDGALALVDPSAGMKPDMCGLLVVDLLRREVVHEIRAPADQADWAVSPDGRFLATGQWNGVVYVWNLRRVLGGPSPPAMGPSDLASSWEALSRDDGVRAYCAMRDLATAGDSAVGFLRERMSPVPSSSAGAQDLIQRLDDDQVSVREDAAEALIHLGPPAIPLVKDALARTKSAEVHSRAEGILEALERPTLHFKGMWARGIRGIEVLESIGTPGAKELLTSIAEGADGPWETEFARRALERARLRAR